MHDLSIADVENAKHIFIIEDDAALAKLLKIMLDKMGYSTYVYNNAVEFLKCIPDLRPSVLISDVKMPKMSGIELQTELLALGRLMPIIFISGGATVPQSITALKQGAVDFLLKPVNKQQLKTAVEAAFELEAIKSQSLTDKATLEKRLSALAPREREVYDLMIKGYKNNEILAALGISLPTTKQYKTAVMRKLNVGSLAELIQMKS